MMSSWIVKMTMIVVNASLLPLWPFLIFIIIIISNSSSSSSSSSSSRRSSSSSNGKGRRSIIRIIIAIIIVKKHLTISSLLGRHHYHHQLHRCRHCPTSNDICVVSFPAVYRGCSTGWSWASHLFPAGLPTTGCSVDSNHNCKLAKLLLICQISIQQTPRGIIIIMIVIVVFTVVVIIFITIMLLVSACAVIVVIFVIDGDGGDANVLLKCEDGNGC